MLFRKFKTLFPTINSSLFTVQPQKTTIRSFRKTPYPIPGTHTRLGTRDRYRHNRKPLNSRLPLHRLAQAIYPLVLVIKNEAIAFPIPWIDLRSFSVTSFNFFLSLVTSLKHLSVRLFESNPYSTRNK